MVEAGKSHAEIGRVLKRKRGAVASRVKVLRETHKNRSGLSDPGTFH
jgi:hypothetical protein